MDRDVRNPVAEPPRHDPATPTSGTQPRPVMLLLRRQYDFPLATTEPRICYVIAATSRSGSTYLAHQLWATGVMGAPLEYFNYRCEMLQMARRMGALHIREYVRGLFALRTSPNGVFGFKTGLHVVIDAGLLPLFPNLRCVRITRSDRLAQAVSLAIAQQTDQWSSLGQPHGTAVYDAERIRKCLALIEKSEAETPALLSSIGLSPIEVCYEDLVADPGSVVGDILRRFGTEHDRAHEVVLPQIERQSSQINVEWIERFGRESG